MRVLRDEGTCVEGGGVMWLVASATRLVCTLETVDAVLSGSDVCAGCGVTGSDTSGGGIKLDKVS